MSLPALLAASRDSAKHRTLWASLAAWVLAVVFWIFLAYALDQADHAMRSLPSGLVVALWFGAASLCWGMYGACLAKWAGWGCRPWVSGVGLALGATVTNLLLALSNGNGLPMKNSPPLGAEHLSAAAAWVVIGLLCGLMWGLFLAQGWPGGHMGVLRTTILLGAIFPASWLIGFLFGFPPSSGAGPYIAFGGIGAAMFGLAVDWLRRRDSRRGEQATTQPAL